MENQHRQITGYRELDAEELALINTIKEHAEVVGKLVDDLGMMALASPYKHKLWPDPSWVSIARTHLQQGFMALTRAIAKPSTF